MKIAFVVPEISKTGGMRIIFEYANRLTADGYEVCVVSPIVPFNAFMGQRSLYYLKYRIKYALRFLTGKIEKPEKFFKINFKIKYILFPYKYFVPKADVYIATSWTSSYLVNEINCNEKLYFVQDYETWAGNTNAVDESYKLKLKKIVVSAYLKNLLKDKFNEESQIVLNGINFEKFNNEVKNDFIVRTILFMDHSLKNKNTKDAVLIAEKIHAKYPDVKFKCFGRDRYTETPEYVQFYKDPSDKEIIKLYRDSDIFLYTSLYEGFALSPAEAMACKCAVVGYNTAGLPDYSVNNKTALLSEAGDLDKLFCNVETLIKDTNLLEKISIAGYNYVREKLNWQTAYNKFKKIILS